MFAFLSRAAALRTLAIVSATATGFACAASPDTDEGDEAALSGDPQMLDVTTFVGGLMANPTSAERKSTAAPLRKIIEIASAQIPASRDATRAADQAFTKQLVEYTAQYLASGKSCEPKQKIRVYRGIGGGSQPVLRATTDERQHGLHVAKPMMDALRRLDLSSPPRDAAGMNALNGVAQYQALVVQKKPLAMRMDSDPAATKALSQRIADTSARTETFRAADDPAKPEAERNLAKQLLADLKDTVLKTDYGFSYQFGLNRNFVNMDTEETQPVNLEFSAIATDHTQGAPWGTGAGAPFSPLISTSVNAIEKWGPMFIVADVCPERAVIATSRVDATEQEVYVPLFILPEEIVAIAPTIDDLQRVPVPRPEDRPLDGAYRACFAQEIATADDGMGAYRSIMKKGLALDEFRNEVTKAVTNACKPTSCPAGCIASNYCKENVSRDPIKSALARYIDGLPCVAAGGGCKIDSCGR